uniref:Asparagine synthetase domain-containing protein n=1 Tax=Hyaloperonospora arabidopsidis (strain Emoy2) TaxID=559515 RepID=M4B9F3_HYAAE
MMLSKKLQSAGRQNVAPKMTTTSVADPVVEVLRQVRGPFAVLWLQATTNRVYFAHDQFGRRSLLYKHWGSDHRRDVIAELAGTKTTSTTCSRTDLICFVLTNVAIGHDDPDSMQYRELPASGVYVLDLHEDQTQTAATTPSCTMEFHPYPPIDPRLALPVSEMEASTDILDRFGCQLPCTAMTSKTTTMLRACAQALLVVLSNAVGLRVRSIPSRLFSNKYDASARVAVFFSGGLDSVVLAALTHFHAPATEPVDLLTVCFDEKSNFASPDRRAAELAHAELCNLFPERQWNLIKINVPREELASKQREVQTLMTPCDTHMDFNIAAAFWFLSRGRGVLTKLTPVAGNTTSKRTDVLLTPQGDSLHDNKARVDLISDSQNANDNPMLRSASPCNCTLKHGCAVGICKSCCSEAHKTASARLDTSSEPVKKQQQQQEQDHPSKDASERSPSSCRVHCSTQTGSSSLSSSTSVPIRTGGTSSIASRYQTIARVVLVGIGADEQLAGYGRHRTTLIHGGEQALRAELEMDLDRLWTRNLGRDDRCIAAHGREARFPYLDENVVSTISNFPVSCLCDTDLPRGVGDKRVLRVVARALGLKSCAGLAKRAIQFGSRIAKVSHTGSNRQIQGDNKFISMKS